MQVEPERPTEQNRSQVLGQAVPRRRIPRRPGEEVRRRGRRKVNIADRYATRGPPSDHRQVGGREVRPGFVAPVRSHLPGLAADPKRGLGRLFLQDDEPAGSVGRLWVVAAHVVQGDVEAEERDVRVEPAGERRQFGVAGQRQGPGLAADDLRRDEEHAGSRESSQQLAAEQQNERVRCGTARQVRAELVAVGPGVHRGDVTVRRVCRDPAVPEVPEDAAALVGRVAAPEEFPGHLVVHTDQQGLDEHLVCCQR